MSLQWRNHADHKSETRVIKAAVIAAGFPRVTVGHGTGTAWAWLKVTVTIPATPHRRFPDQFQRLVCAGNCSGCESRERVTNQLHAIIRQVTGRSGEYNGHTIVTVEERT